MTCIAFAVIEATAHPAYKKAYYEVPTMPTFSIVGYVKPHGVERFDGLERHKPWVPPYTWTVQMAAVPPVAPYFRRLLDRTMKKPQMRRSVGQSKGMPSPRRRNFIQEGAFFYGSQVIQATAS